MENIIIIISIVIGLLILLGFLFYYAEKYYSIIEATKQAKAYELIATEEELNIKHIQDQEKREKELHKKQIEAQAAIVENEKKRTELLRNSINQSIRTSYTSALRKEK